MESVILQIPRQGREGQMTRREWNGNTGSMFGLALKAGTMTNRIHRLNNSYQKNDPTADDWLGIWQLIEGRVHSHSNTANNTAIFGAKIKKYVFITNFSSLIAICLLLWLSHSTLKTSMVDSSLISHFPSGFLSHHLNSLMVSEKEVYPWLSFYLHNF